MAATKEVVTSDPGDFGFSILATEEYKESERLRNALLKAQLDEAYLRTHPHIFVSDATASSGTIQITGLNEYGEVVVEDGVGDVWATPSSEFGPADWERGEKAYVGSRKWVTKAELEEM